MSKRVFQFTLLPTLSGKDLKFLLVGATYVMEMVGVVVTHLTFPNRVISPVNVRQDHNGETNTRNRETQYN